MKNRTIWTVLAATSLGGGPAFAAGLTIEDRIVNFQMHADPFNPESDVVFKIRLFLEPYGVHRQGQSGGRIDWKVARIELTQILGPSTQRSWSEQNPFVNTASGLWQTQHADLTALQDAEFTQPPSMDGFASPVNHTGSDLVYDLGTGSGTAPVFAATGYLEYMAQQESEPEPEAEGDDEPVEVDSVQDPT